MKRTGIMFAIVLVLVIVCDLVVMGFAKSADSGQEGQEALSEEDYEELNRMIRAGLTDDALKLLDRMEDHTSKEYYYLKEIILLEDGSEKANERLAELYREASDQWPKWQHMQKMAGVAAIYEGNYDSASYRLTAALRLDTEDAETWYYLGVLAYQKGNYEDMRTYFEAALQRELSETKQQQILWYAEQTGDRE